MIVMSRQQFQSIIIGGNIRLTIIDIKGDRVRIGIEAPMGTNLEQLQLPDRNPPTPPPGQANERTT